MQVGIDSFTAWDDNGLPSSERLQSLIEQIEYADQIGLDVPRVVASFKAHASY